MHAAQGDRPSLSALISQALVAFTIEFDNEFEHQMPHRTSNHGSTSRSDSVPWLVSMPMWVHCVRHVPEEGIAAGELIRRTQLPVGSARMILRRMSNWWGYLVVRPDPSDARAKPPPSAWVVRATRAGRRAQRVWAPLMGLIDTRWRTRFGAAEVDRLRVALEAMVNQLDVELPAYMPVGEQSRSWRVALSAARPARASSPGSGLSIPELLSKLLVSFALDFERGSAVSLALSANVLRVLDDEHFRVRDLPALSGVAAMGVENSLSLLEKGGYITVGTAHSGGRERAARLTTKGRHAQDTHVRRVGEIEHEWRARFGERTVHAARGSLEGLVGSGTAEDSRLFGGLAPYPEGWRSQLPRPGTLPHCPMVSHRGGFPDGS